MTRSGEWEQVPVHIRSPWGCDPMDAPPPSMSAAYAAVWLARHSKALHVQLLARLVRFYFGPRRAA